MERKEEYKDKFSEIDKKFIDEIDEKKINDLGKPTPHMLLVKEHLKEIAENWKPLYFPQELFAESIMDFEYDLQDLVESLKDLEYTPSLELMEIKEKLGIDFFNKLDLLSRLHESGSKEEYDKKFEEMKESLKKDVENLFSGHLEHIAKIYAGVRKLKVPEEEEERNKFVRRIEKKIADKLKSMYSDTPSRRRPFLSAPPEIAEGIKKAVIKGLEETGIEDMKEIGKGFISKDPTDKEIELFGKDLIEEVEGTHPRDLVEMLFNQERGVAEEPVDSDYTPYPYDLLEALQDLEIIHNRRKFYNYFVKQNKN